MIRIEEETRDDIPAYEMLDGDIGVITAWSFDSYIGCTVQRWGDHLVCVGAPCSQSLSEWFISASKAPDKYAKEYRVRVFGKGTKLVIV